MHVNFDPQSPALDEIEFSDYLKVDLRLGRITEVRDFPEAKNPSYILMIDFGKGVGVKKSSAQITDLYTKEDLMGKSVLAVVNFPPRQIGPIKSEVLVLGLSNEKNQTVLMEIDKSLPLGTRLT